MHTHTHTQGKSTRSHGARLAFLAWLTHRKPLFLSLSHGCFYRGTALPEASWGWKRKTNMIACNTKNENRLSTVRSTLAPHSSFNRTGVGGLYLRVPTNVTTNQPTIETKQPTNCVGFGFVQKNPGSILVRFRSASPFPLTQLTVHGVGCPFRCNTWQGTRRNLEREAG